MSTRNTVKTKNIESTFRNAATPTARLAAWQSKPAPRRLAEIREYLGKTYHAGETIAQARRALLAAQGPELSSPEAEKHLLWVSEGSPEVLDAFAGRDFLTHRGWYTDEHESETLETYAIRLARFPRLLFYAVLDSCNGDFRVNLQNWEDIDFSPSGYRSADCPETAIQDAARSLVSSNDSSTEREAEEAREFYRKDQAEQDIETNRGELKSLRREIRNLVHELKALCPSPLAGEYPAASKAIRRALSGLLTDRCKLMEENETLAASI